IAEGEYDAAAALSDAEALEIRNVAFEEAVQAAVELGANEEIVREVLRDQWLLLQRQNKERERAADLTRQQARQALEMARAQAGLGPERTFATQNVADAASIEQQYRLAVLRANQEFEQG